MEIDYKSEAYNIYQHLFDPNKPLSEENIVGYLAHKLKEVYEKSIQKT